MLNFVVMNIIDLIDAPKPCLVTWRGLEDFVFDNLAELANHPLDVVGPDRLEVGIANLAKKLKCNIEKQADYTYLISPAVA